MRILLTGATGLIGGAIARALLGDGHELVCAVREPSRLALQGAQALQADLSEVPGAAWWLPHLRGIDAVVNAVGILRQQGRQTFDALHHRAPAELFRACAQAGVRCVIQVSALGADERGTTPYQVSKKAADDVLRALPLAGAVVQPSLVYSPQGASSELFLMLASAPALAFPLRGAMAVQPVHLDDVVAGVLALLRAPPARIETIAFAGPAPMPLRAYLGGLRRALGLGAGPRMLPLPVPLFRIGARVAARLPGSALDPDTAHMLLQGNAAPAERFMRLLGRAPRGIEGFVAQQDAPALRTRAVLGWTLPMLKSALAAMWIWTAVVSFGLYPVQDSYALLARVGLHGAAATLALYGAAVLDLVLGILTLAAPALWRSWVWAAQLLLIAGYTLLITFFLPEQWLHPYGPISKNLPIMAAIALLWALEPPRRRS
ncbi:MAG TPA: SDR family oxidoreductase [Ramlibacter sp.]|nr:SDR family oxidoreductase [Ramlibacter sp.]